MTACASRVLGACALFALGTVAAAQSSGSDPFPRFEISLLSGYRFIGTLTFSESALDSRVEIDDTPVYSVSAGYNLGPVFAVELFYGYAAPSAIVRGRSAAEPDRAVGLSIHEVQPGLIAYFAPPDENVRPYAELLVGFSVFGDHEGIGSDNVRLTPGLSLGTKVFFGEHVGVRAEVHYTPMFLYTTDNGELICFEENICWNTGDRYLQQVDVRAGVTFRF